MAKSTSIKDAIKMFETISGLKASEAEKVDLYGQIPPIEKMDTSLATLKACKYVPTTHTFLCHTIKHNMFTMSLSTLLTFYFHLFN